MPGSGDASRSSGLKTIRLAIEISSGYEEGLQIGSMADRQIYPSLYAILLPELGIGWQQGLILLGGNVRIADQSYSPERSSRGPM